MAPTLASWVTSPFAVSAHDEITVSPPEPDRAALTGLYEGHAPAVRRFLRGLLGSDAAADDGTQETFVRAFRRLHTLRDAACLRPWLFGIARLVAMELFRARGRLAPSDATPETPDRDTPESMLLGEETARIVAFALTTLSEDRRAALLLRVDHGLAYDEIADAMGWSLAKAKIEVHRARLVLRAHLDEGGAR